MEKKVFTVEYLKKENTMICWTYQGTSYLNDKNSKLKKSKHNIIINILVFII